MSGPHYVSITGFGHQAKTRSSIKGDNVPPHIQSRIEASTKSLSLTTTTRHVQTVRGSSTIKKVELGSICNVVKETYIIIAGISSKIKRFT